VTNHLAHDTEERKGLMNFMSQLEATNHALADAVKKQSEDSATRAKNMWAELSKMNAGIEVLKDRR